LSSTRNIFWITYLRAKKPLLAAAERLSGR